MSAIPWQGLAPPGKPNRYGRQDAGAIARYRAPEFQQHLDRLRDEGREGELQDILAAERAYVSVRNVKVAQLEEIVADQMEGWEDTPAHG
jgi:hypothetical protein